MSNRIVLAIAVALIARDAMAQDSAAAKPRTAALAGMVRDQFGRPITQASVVVDSTPLKAVTNDSGLFFLPGIPAGKSNFTVTHLGFAVVQFQIDLAADTTLVVNIPMRRLQTMPTVDVKGEQLSAKLMRAGYYERRNIGLGSFIGPEKIDKLQWSSLPSTFLRDARGVRIRCASTGLATDRCRVTLGTGCGPTIYVNRVRRTGQLDQVVDPSEVYAIEVYDRAAYVPIDFMPSPCVIAIWTRTYVDMPSRKP